MKKSLVLLLSGFAFYAMAQVQSAPANQNEVEQSKEALEIGGVVTVDAGADMSSLKKGELEIGTVDLSAKVNVASDVTAAITVSAGEDLDQLGISNAVVEWAPESKPYVGLFGQQTYNHGLLSTHLISDPMITGHVETHGPGIAANYEYKALSAGAGLTYVHTNTRVHEEHGINWDDSSITTTTIIDQDEQNAFGFVLNCDYAFPERATTRLSMRYMDDAVDISIGGSATVKEYAFDAELNVTPSGNDGSRFAGYYIGLANHINDHLDFALRYDAISPNDFENMVHKVSAGINIPLIHDIYCAFEYSYETTTTNADAVQTICLQIGLESSLKLPGFQRKTLTQNLE